MKSGSSGSLLNCKQIRLPIGRASGHFSRRANTHDSDLGRFKFITFLRVISSNLVGELRMK